MTARDAGDIPAYPDVKVHGPAMVGDTCVPADATLLWSHSPRTLWLDGSPTDLAAHRAKGDDQ